MEDILETLKTKEDFDTYWADNYVPLTYEDVQEAFEDVVTALDKHIFISDYEEKGCISKSDFADNLSQAAAFSFQDTLTEIFYEKNPEVYEVAFAIYEEAQMSGNSDANIAATFHEEYNRLYKEFLGKVYDKFF